MKYKKYLIWVVVIVLALVGSLSYVDYENNGISNDDSKSNDSTQEVIEENDKNDPNDEERQEEVQEKIEEKDESLEEYKTEKEEQGLTVEIQDSYEKWLAATMVLAITMHYDNYKIEHIYLDDTTEVNDHLKSRGAYVVIATNGQELILHSKPLVNERTEAGTIDISSETTGLATFDEVTSIEADTMKEVSLEDLKTFINQSFLVSVYEHYGD